MRNKWTKKKIKLFNKKVTEHLDTLLRDIETGTATAEDAIVESCGSLIAVVLLGFDVNEIVRISEESANKLLNEMEKDELTNESE